MLDEELITRLCREIESRFEALSKGEADSQPQPRGNLYHYTGPEGLVGIIQEGEVYATNVLYMNDHSELSGAREVLRDQLEATNIKLLENAAWFLKTVYVIDDLPLDHFVVSFCEEGDLLGQWRGYGSKGTGFSIGFFPSTFAAAAVREENRNRGVCTLQRVKYDESEKIALIQKRIAFLREILEPHAEELEPQLNEEFRQLNRLLYQIAASFEPTLALMKHTSFGQEQEWRFIRTLWKPPVPTVEWPVRVRVVGDRLAPYLPISWPFPKKSEDGKLGIAEVVCGPSSEPQLREKAVRDLLIANECWRVPVRRSTVPLRA